MTITLGPLVLTIEREQPSQFECWRRFATPPTPPRPRWWARLWKGLTR